MLREVVDRGTFRYVCRVGHAYAPEALESAQVDRIETALWSSVRALEENADFARELADRARRQGMDRAAERFDHRAADSEEHASAIRRLLTRIATPAHPRPSRPGPSGEADTAAR